MNTPSSTIFVSKHCLSVKGITDLLAERLILELRQKKYKMDLEHFVVLESLKVLNKLYLKARACQRNAEINLKVSCTQSWSNLRKKKKKVILLGYN